MDKITYWFRIFREPFTIPLYIRRNVFSWDEVLAEFPDAVRINELDIMSRDWEVES